MPLALWLQTNMYWIFHLKDPMHAYLLESREPRAWHDFICNFKGPQYPQNTNQNANQLRIIALIVNEFNKLLRRFMSLRNQPSKKGQITNESFRSNNYRCLQASSNYKEK